MNAWFRRRFVFWRRGPALIIPILIFAATAIAQNEAESRSTAIESSGAGRETFRVSKGPDLIPARRVDILFAFRAYPPRGAESNRR